MPRMLKEPTKRRSHRVWIALQGYAAILAGIYVGVELESPGLGLVLLAAGFGAHDWSRELAFGLVGLALPNTKED